jgi:uncharacterized FlaG/YvyC family protein
MDVTPILKPGLAPTSIKSEEIATASGSRSGVTQQGALQPTGNTATSEIEDPVRRAEQTIGAFFEEESNPKGRFTIDKDKDSGRFVYRLINSDTGEVLKQFPGDYVLRRVAYYRELEGIAVDSQV